MDAFCYWWKLMIYLLMLDTLLQKCFPSFVIQKEMGIYQNIIFSLVFVPARVCFTPLISTFKCGPGQIQTVFGAFI